MMTYYTHRYSDVKDLKNHEVIANYPNGSKSVTDPHNEVDWVNGGNTPTKVSDNRFISIVDDKVILDPNMADILASEKSKEELNDKVKDYKYKANKELISKEVLKEAKIMADTDKEVEAANELQKELDNL